MDSESVGGIGEVPPVKLPRFMARYRFFFHPIRYTSLGLAVCEAMMLGKPAVCFLRPEWLETMRAQIPDYVAELPSLVDEINAGTIAVKPNTMPLADVEAIWTRPDPPGERTVLVP